MNNLLKMVSLNVKGLRGANKRRAIVEWSKQKGDIIFFQETFSTIDIENQWDREWNGKLNIHSLHCYMYYYYLITVQFNFFLCSTQL